MALQVRCKLWVQDSRRVVEPVLGEVWRRIMVRRRVVVVDNDEEDDDDDEFFSVENAAANGSDDVIFRPASGKRF